MVRGARCCLTPIWVTPPCWPLRTNSSSAMTLREMAGVAAKGQWTEVDAGLPPARPERARDRCPRTLPLWFAGEPLIVKIE